MVDGVTKAKEISSAWAVLNEVITDNITDPANPPRPKSGDWIKNGFPNPGDFCKKSGGWIFPLIIINLSDISDEVKVLDQSKHQITHSVSIEVHSVTRKQAGELSEQIREILQTTAVSELVTSTLYLVGIDGSTIDSDFIGSDNKFYTYTIDYRFKRFD